MIVEISKQHIDQFRVRIFGFQIGEELRFKGLGIKGLIEQKKERKWGLSLAEVRLVYTRIKLGHMYIITKYRFNPGKVHLIYRNRN